MISLFYNSVKKNYYSQRRIWLFQYRLYKFIINITFPILFRRFCWNGVEENSEVIVSLTSFPDRIDTVWMTIVTLLRQSKKPQKVILWLAEEQFEGKKLPNNLLRLQNYGLEIRWCDDLKPHKKYFYCMQEYTDKCIVIADDDIFYPENHLQLLWENYKKHPNCVIANKTHRIGYNPNGECKSYNEWDDLVRSNPSYLLLPIGCNGVLYPPRLLNENILFNKEILLTDVLYVDDLWLKVCALKSDIKTFSCIKNELVYFDIVKAGKSGLWKTNTTGVKRNDNVWRSLMLNNPELDTKLFDMWKEEEET